ncbi:MULTISPECIES: hypothetical protein [Metabacillus]|uniref:hypothetical protein n=1 Tax=Metabacillus TaxID=2675233 RepID=UPI000A6B6C69|nr:MULTISPECIES: hypothetical protein [Metabacillus]MDX8290176.1 hypothetical protein [Metabacillus indicus]
MNYTTEMEKALMQSHKMGYAVYSRNHEKRMEVEKNREEDYQKSKQLFAELDRKMNG